jgi:4-amino-4-deoxy-L-arabinose transferase-like glycosyltransferase
MVIFFLNLGGASLWDIDEGRNSACAFRMYESGDWVVPMFNGKLRVDKPVLLYWLEVLSYFAFGVSEFSARFPSAVAALATVLLIYELARSMFSRTTGLLAGVSLATMPMLCAAGRFANPDALLNACTVLTLTIFWLGRSTQPWWWFAGLGVASGLAVLAKGPVGLVLPSTVVFLFVLWERRLILYWDRRWLLACLTFTLTAVPWYAWVTLETHGEFAVGFFWKHNVERSVRTMESHDGFFGYYLVVLLAGTAPWSVFILGAWWYGFWSAIRSPLKQCHAWWAHANEEVARSGGEHEAQDSGPIGHDTRAAYRLLIAWVFTYLLFFSVVATKLPNYVLPAVAPCAILIARFLHRWQTGLLRLPSWMGYAGVLGLVVMGQVVTIGAAVAGGLVELEALRGRFIPGLQPWLWTGLVPLATAALGWHFIRRGEYRRFLVAVSISAVVWLGPLAAYGSVVFNRHKAPRPLVEQSQALRSDRDQRVGAWRLEYLPSLTFYVQRDVDHLESAAAVADFLRAPVPSYLFVPRSDWEQLDPKVTALGRIVAAHADLYQHQEILVVSNR